MHQNIDNIAIKCVFCYGQFYALQSNEIGIAIQKMFNIDIKTLWIGSTRILTDYINNKKMSSDLKIL